MSACILVQINKISYVSEPFWAGIRPSSAPQPGLGSSGAPAPTRWHPTMSVNGARLNGSAPETPGLLHITAWMTGNFWVQLRLSNLQAGLLKLTFIESFSSLQLVQDAAARALTRTRKEATLVLGDWGVGWSLVNHHQNSLSLNVEYVECVCRKMGKFSVRPEEHETTILFLRDDVVNNIIRTVFPEI